MADELYDARNGLALGNYHQAIADATSAKTSSRKADEVQAFNNERDALVGQAQIGLGQFDIVMSDLKTSTAPILVATRHWAAVQKALRGGASNDEAFTALVELAGDAPSAAKAPVAVLAASAALSRDDAATALKIAATWASHKELEGAGANARNAVALRAIAVHALLRLNRIDLAEKEVTAMRNVDDDAVACILANITVDLRAGATKPDRYVNAEVLVNELVGRCGQSVLLLNLLALAKLGQGKTAEAEQLLLDALSKRSGDADTLANMAVVAAQSGKAAEVTARYVTQAAAAGSTNPWVQAYQSMESRFVTAAQETM